MIENRASYSVDSSVQSVNQAEDIARSVAADAGFQPKEVEDIAIAVREAAINAAVHGNAGDPSKKVLLVMERLPDGLRITVTDEGKGFDPGALPDPLAPENLLKQSGRGVFLMRAYMDEVRFRRLKSGMETVLIKYFRGAPAKGKETPKP